MSKRDFPKCNKTDCFGFNDVVGHCTVLKASPRDAPIKNCSFYKSDPKGDIHQKIERDVENYFRKVEGRK